MKLAIALLLVSLIQKGHLVSPTIRRQPENTSPKIPPTSTPKHRDEVTSKNIPEIHGSLKNGSTIPDTTFHADHKPTTEKIVPSAHIPIRNSISIPITISIRVDRSRDTSFPANISFPANSVFIENITSKALIEFPKNVPFLANFSFPPKIPFQKSRSFGANVSFTKNSSFSANMSFPKNNLSEANILFTTNTSFQANITFPANESSPATIIFPKNISFAVTISFPATKTSTTINILATTVTISTEKSPTNTPSSTVTPSVSKSTSSSASSSSARTSFSASITPAISSSGTSVGSKMFCQLSFMPTDNNKNKNFNDFCPNVTSTKSSQANQHEFECVKTATKGYVHMKTCSSNWIDSTIRGYCQDTHPVNSSLWLTVPVTKNGITFKNIFCLLCQNEKPTDWSFWELGFYCVDQSTGHAAKILEGSPNISAFKPNEAGFWTYTEAEQKYTCFLHPEVPTNSNYSRCCQVLHTKKVQNTCFRNDSHVYADCVIQSYHNVSKNLLCNPMPIKMNMTFNVKLTKEMIPPFPHCDGILKNSTLHNITCQSKPSSTLLSANSSDISSKKDIPYPVKKSSLPSTLTSGLLMLSSLVLILHLLIFCSLPEKNLWDKCLFVFSIMLLVQSVSVIYGTYYYYYTRYVSILWHYLILGCSTWILILSYDYRVNLYKTTRIYTGPDTRAQIKFWFYSTFGCGLPLLLTSLIFYFAPSEELSEDTQHGRLIKHTPRTFFWVSAFLLSLAGCYLRFLIAFMVFLDHRLRYTRQRLYMPGKIVLMMAATWMLTSLWMLSYLSTPDWALHLLHLLQVVFFLIFTFSQIKGRYRTNEGGPEAGRTAKKKDSAGPVNLLQPKVNLEQFTEEHFESITKQFTQNDTIPRALNTYTNVDFKF